MNRTTKNLLKSSLLMLLIAAISLSSATYAWFTLGDETSVEEIEFSAQAGGGIQISANMEVWGSTVTLTQLQNAIGSGKGQETTNVYNESLTTVSTNAAVSGNALTMYTGKISETEVDQATGNPYFVTEAIAEGGASGFYQVFNLYFKNTGTDPKELLLELADAGKSVVRDAVTDENSPSYGVKTEEIARVAFVPVSTTDADGNETTITNGARLLWEPNADGTAYYGVKEAGRTLDWDSNAMLINRTASLVDNTAIATYTDEVNAKIATINGGEILKVRVYIWLEGQDHQALNTASIGSIAVALNFTAAK